MARPAVIGGVLGGSGACRDACPHCGARHAGIYPRGWRWRKPRRARAAAPWWPQLRVRWLLDEIWAVHRERTRGGSSNCFRGLEAVTQGLSPVFSAGLSLGSCSTSLARHCQKCVSESPPDTAPDHCAAPQSLPASGPPRAPLPCQGKPSQSPVRASPTTAAAQQQPVPASLASESPVSALQRPSAAPQLLALQRQPETPQALLLRKEPVSPQSSLVPSSPAAELEAMENPGGDSEEESNRRTEERIKQSLGDICTGPAARLCSELAVVQKCVQLTGTGEDALRVQVLEDAHRADLKGLSSGTCHFGQVLQLPCRHILAGLSSRQTLQPEMPSTQWQRGCDARQAGQDSADGLLEVLESSWNGSLDKSLLVSFLTAKISRRLAHCSREEFERRSRTLRELADSWIGPYVEVKL
ncbi:LOW QUALITY PROTEIN: uncharacterized protein VSU04_011184 [Chlamydotis macqueenii]